MTIRFDGRVAIVTGAGNGLGRAHALGLAARGAKVVVNDLGARRDGTGGSSEAAEKVVEEIKAQGGEAIANGANVSDLVAVQDMVDQTIAKWGRVDILVNNAGILRDKSFAKSSLPLSAPCSTCICGAAWFARRRYGRSCARRITGASFSPPPPPASTAILASRITAPPRWRWLAS
jgi:NAD(P)-dependent dehydrogenase (short-subunit alcohol dehydrogenase family)